ncbi:hypothetical protein DFQ26_002456 [Actinomortierella ambigua]|nr:hypothetical protein DFQ26_002456 [Actinomortierella ambigua]
MSTMPPQSYPQQQPRQQQQQQQQQRQQQQQQEQQQEQQQQHRGNQHRGNDTERYETRGSLDALVDAALDTTPLDQQRQLRQQPPLSAPKVETSNVRSGMSISSLLQRNTLRSQGVNNSDDKQRSDVEHRLDHEPEPSTAHMSRSHSSRSPDTIQRSDRRDSCQDDTFDDEGMQHSVASGAFHSLSPNLHDTPAPLDAILQFVIQFKSYG